MAGPGHIAEFHHVTGTTIALLFNFDVAQDKLKLEHQTWLRKNALDLLRYGGSLWLMGLTSTTGPESFNSPLSQRRAESVVVFLRRELSKGFPVKLDTSVGLGCMCRASTTLDTIGLPPVLREPQGILLSPM